MPGTPIQKILDSFRLRQPPQTVTTPRPETPEDRVLKALVGAQTPLSQRQVRERAATRNETVSAVLKKLVGEQKVRHDAEGRYSLTASQSEKAATAANGCDPDAAR